jgi:transposase
MVMSDRAGRWVTEQVGRYARSVNEIAIELGCDWHTVNDTVIAYGVALVDDDPERFGTVEALGLDEVLFARIGAWRRQEFSTQIVDVGRGQLLDVVPGRSGEEPTAWLEARGEEWRDKVRYATLDLSSPYRKVFTTMVPDAVQVADPFHLVKLANTKLDECRRRVQNETMGHRGRKSDPLYRCRRLLTKADERLSEHGREKLLGLLRAGDPNGDVVTMWRAKEAVRELYTHEDPDLALEWVERLGADLQDADYPTEARSLGRMLIRWKHQIAAWHQAHVSNGPTEAVNNLIKRVKRAAFGFTSFRNYRIRSLLYAGKPNWSLLPTVTPR